MHFLARELKGQSIDPFGLLLQRHQAGFVVKQNLIRAVHIFQKFSAFVDAISSVLWPGRATVYKP